MSISNIKYDFLNSKLSLREMSILKKDLSTSTIFNNLDQVEKNNLLNLINYKILTDINFDRCAGAFMGMSYGDFIGAPVEFLQARNTSSTVSFNKELFSMSSYISNNVPGFMPVNNSINDINTKSSDESRDETKDETKDETNNIKQNVDTNMHTNVNNCLISLCSNVDDNYEETYYNKIYEQIHYKEKGGIAPLKVGQWTDDTSMGLCLADSLIVKKGFDGSDQRIRYWNWWNCSYNNAFRFDQQQHSVGLGGNISKSIKFKIGEIPEPIYNSSTVSNDSGNGSIMRLAAIPIFYHKSPQSTLRKYAILSSLTTHPGDDASEACAFMSYIIYEAINRTKFPVEKSKEIENINTSNRFATLKMMIKQKIGNMINKKKVSTLTPIQEFLEDIISKYNTNNKNLKKLIASNEPKNSTEYCWNWRSSSIDIENTIKNRGKYYNGYPVNSNYFGSYCFDGLAIALHSLYNTTNFENAILKTVNMLGDSDSTGAICGQMAGAFYGFSKINPIFYKLLRKWDHEEIIMRVLFLYGSASHIAD
jgi:ADP-ribosyl-[dinitrogen reductase] hydrolase